MKVIVTGGLSGFGKQIVDSMQATSLSRRNGYDITKSEDIQRIVELSLECDVFVNNAFDGNPIEEWGQFGQVKLYYALHQAWKNANKSGYIFNIGSTGNKLPSSLAVLNDGYRSAKAALEYASKQGSLGFKKNEVKFKTTLINFDRLDTELSRSRLGWNGNGVKTDEVVEFMKLMTLNASNNMSVEEITFILNIFYKAEK
jgi:hypothetical protein